MSPGDSGDQWRGALPDDWGDVTQHPPRLETPRDDIRTVDYGTHTLFRVVDSGTCWLQAPDDLVVEADEWG